MNSAMEQMLAERQRQDAGLFSAEATAVSTVAVATKLEDKPLIKLYKQASDKPIDTTECYSLSS
jgi:hypothetical protein